MLNRKVKENKKNENVFVNNFTFWCSVLVVFVVIGDFWQVFGCGKFLWGLGIFGYMGFLAVLGIFGGTGDFWHYCQYPTE